MKKVFVVKIGRTSRRGSFETLIERFVETGLSDYALRDAMKDIYRGLEVKVEQVETIESLEKAVPQDTENLEKPDTREPGVVYEVQRINSFKKLTYDLTAPRFSELFEATKNALGVYNNARKALNEAVRKHIKNMPWIDTTCGISLDDIKIDYSYNRAEISDVRMRFEVIEAEVLALPTPPSPPLNGEPAEIK